MESSGVMASALRMLFCPLARRGLAKTSQFFGKERVATGLALDTVYQLVREMRDELTNLGLCQRLKGKCDQYLLAA